MEHKEKRSFLSREIFSTVKAAALHRSGLFLPDTGESRRRELQDDLRRRLEAMAPHYVQDVPDLQHEDHIERLTVDLSRMHGDHLAAGRFPWSLAQKAMNLYLKHLWCLGWIEMPPHCPIDAFVLAHVEAQPPGGDWNGIENRAVYRSVINALRARARSTPLALWELQLTNRANGGY